MNKSNESAEKREAVQQLEAALSTEQVGEMKYHVRQALQLLDLE